MQDAPSFDASTAARTRVIGAVIVRLSAARHRPHAGSCEQCAVDLESRASTLTITGKAPDLVVRWAHHAMPAEPHVDHADAGNTHVGNGPAARYELVKLATEAKQALVTLKVPKQLARDAVTAAVERVGPSATLEQLIREALRSLRPTT